MRLFCLVSLFLSKLHIRWPRRLLKLAHDLVSFFEFTVTIIHPVFHPSTVRPQKSSASAAPRALGKQTGSLCRLHSLDDNKYGIKSPPTIHQKFSFSLSAHYQYRGGRLIAFSVVADPRPVFRGLQRRILCPLTTC